MRAGAKNREQRKSVAGERESMRERWESKVWESKDVKKKKEGCKKKKSFRKK